MASYSKITVNCMRRSLGPCYEASMPCYTVRFYIPSLRLFCFSQTTWIRIASGNKIITFWNDCQVFLSSLSPQTQPWQPGQGVRWISWLKFVITLVGPEPPNTGRKGLARLARLGLHVSSLQVISYTDTVRNNPGIVDTLRFYQRWNSGSLNLSSLDLAPGASGEP